MCYVALWNPGFIKCDKNYNLVPWIGEQPNIEMLIQQFSNISIYIRVVVIMCDQHCNVLLFSNPWDKVLKNMETTEQICPLLSTRIRTLSPGLNNFNKLKCWSAIIQTTVIYVVMLQNLWSNILGMFVLQFKGHNWTFCWNGWWKSTPNYCCWVCSYYSSLFLFFLLLLNFY